MGNKENRFKVVYKDGGQLSGVCEKISVNRISCDRIYA